MDTFASTMANAKALSEDEQKKAGQAIGGDMGDEHKHFAKTVSELLESGAINVDHPETFLHQTTYEKLEPEWKAKVDVANVNIATLLRHIHEFYRSKQTPDACPQLATMIEQLWEMKSRIETHADVFKF